MIELLAETGAIGFLAEPVSRSSPDHVLGPGIVRVGLHESGPRPDDGLSAYDMVLTTDTDAPAPWIAVEDLAEEVTRLEQAVQAQPLAAAVAAQVFRVGERLDFDSALLLESLAYSTLLASEGFRCWHRDLPPQKARMDAGERVRMERRDGKLEIVLNRPRGRNAVDAAMRDALCEALSFALDDPDNAPVLLRSDAAVFSVGGDLGEFGTQSDPATGHSIRTLRSPVRLLHRLGDRATAALHGPCVGSGIEIPLAAAKVIARPRTSFRLPEVSMGLIPGAGGTVSVARRIGRQRACWMSISGRAVEDERALAWGLIDAVSQ